MRSIVDAQVPPALARWLSKKGHPADHVTDLGLATATDMAIWIIALDLSAAIISKDQDFAELRACARHGPSIVWVRMPNTRRAELLDRFGRMLPAVIQALQRGDVIVDVS